MNFLINHKRIENFMFLVDWFSSFFFLKPSSYFFINLDIVCFVNGWTYNPWVAFSFFLNPWIFPLTKQTVNRKLCVVCQCFNFSVSLFCFCGFSFNSLFCSFFVVVVVDCTMSEEEIDLTLHLGLPGSTAPARLTLPVLGYNFSPKPETLVTESFIFITASCIL